MKAIEIINVYEALTKMAEKEMDLKTACIIAENIKTLSIYKEKSEEKRDKIILEYAEKDDDGNPIITENNNVKISNMPECNGKIVELLNTDLDVEIKKIPKSSLENLSLSPKDILPLLDYLSE